MATTNYFSGIVKILETPKQGFIRKQTSFLTVRVELPQRRKNRIVALVFWGNLSRKVKDFYKLNDYILIEGYVSLRKKKSSQSRQKNSKRVTITVLKVYPVLLDINRNRSAIEK